MPRSDLGGCPSNDALTRTELIAARTEDGRATERRARDAARKRRKRAELKRVSRSKPATPTRTSQGLEAPVHEAKRAHAEDFRWEAAEGGNYLALTHGARSPRVLARTAESMVEWLLEERPDLAAPRHRVDVSRWAEAEALAAHYFWGLDQRHPLDENAEPRESLRRAWQASVGVAERARDRLGVGPVSEARLAQLRSEAALAGFDVQAAIAAGRKIVEARAPRAIGAPEDEDEPGDAA